MGRAGAEMALLELLRQIDNREYELYLYVLMGQGEMIGQVPSHVRLLNSDYSNMSVLTAKGRRRMARTVLLSFCRNGDLFGKLYSAACSLASMAKNRDFQMSKLFWRVLSEGAKRHGLSFDLAVAWLEGGSAYYVAEHVDARRKAAFIHTDYGKSGYTREMDRACWRQYERVFAVSGEVKTQFQTFYPEYAEKVEVFYNIINQSRIRRLAGEQGGFSDDYPGIRLLTVGRLTYQKGYDIAVQALEVLKASGYHVRWYVLGEGDWRRVLEKRIESMKLKEDFLLLGAVENPYPYFAQADIYVHATRVEGRSVAIQEAQTLGCAVIASDCSGNREQIIDGSDGILCALEPYRLADCIKGLIDDKEKREQLGKNAGLKEAPKGQAEKLFQLLA